MYKMLGKSDLPVMKLTGETNRCHLADRSCRVLCESETDFGEFSQHLYSPTSRRYEQCRKISIFEATIECAFFSNIIEFFSWTSFNFHSSRLSDERFLPAGERTTIVTSFSDPNQTLASIKQAAEETSETFKITTLPFFVSCSY